MVGENGVFTKRVFVEKRISGIMYENPWRTKSHSADAHAYKNYWSS